MTGLSREELVGEGTASYFTPEESLVIASERDRARSQGCSNRARRVLGALPGAGDAGAALDGTLRPADCVVLYTDGMTDAFDSRGGMLGVEGVEKLVRETATPPFPKMKRGILDHVAEWRGGPPADDISLVLVEVQ
jgi:hypothetical protein